MQSTTASIPRGARSRARLTALLSDYWMLTKPEVNFLIVITTLGGVLFGLASASLADPAAVQYAIGNFARSQRDRHTQSVHRTSFRFTHAPYVETAFACRANCRRPRSVVRPCAFHRRWSVVGDFRKSDCQPHRSADAGYVFAFLYSAEAADSAMYLSWCISGRSATPDRMRCRDGQNNLGGLAALRDSLPVAVSAFHGYRLDVSGGLCAGGVSDLTSWTTTDALSWFGRRWFSHPPLCRSRSCLRF